MLNKTNILIDKSAYIYDLLASIFNEAMYSLSK